MGTNLSFCKDIVRSLRIYQVMGCSTLFVVLDREQSEVLRDHLMNLYSVIYD